MVSVIGKLLSIRRRGGSDHGLCTNWHAPRTVISKSHSTPDCPKICARSEPAGRQNSVVRLEKHLTGETRCWRQPGIVAVFWCGSLRDDRLLTRRWRHCRPSKSGDWQRAPKVLSMAQPPDVFAPTALASIPAARFDLISGRWSGSVAGFIRTVKFAHQGYPIDSSTPNGWYFSLSVPPTSRLYGTAGT
jgi:hypothetical protein